MEGEALVSAELSHFSTNFDEKTGMGKRKGHALFGKTTAGKILVAPIIGSL